MNNHVNTKFATSYFLHLDIFTSQYKYNSIMYYNLNLICILVLTFFQNLFNVIF